jgi:molecular chaperone GrpE (heat shock protein)
MKSIETRRYEMLVRVRNFGQTFGHLFPQSSLAGQMFATVADAVKQLEQHNVARMSTAPAGKNTRATARTTLRNRLEAIARTAREITESTPGLQDKFALPEGKNDQELLTAGRLFVRDVEPFKAQFIALALPPTFVTDLTQVVDNFERALRDRDAGKSENTAAKASIEAALASGLAAVRKLDVIVANTLQDDSVTTAVWERERRVRYRNRMKAAVTPASPVPEPPASSAASTDVPAAPHVETPAPETPTASSSADTVGKVAA